MKNLALTFGIAATVFFTASCNNDDILEGCTPETPKATAESNFNLNYYSDDDDLSDLNCDDFIGPKEYTDLTLSFADNINNRVQTRGITGNWFVDWAIEKGVSFVSGKIAEGPAKEFCKAILGDHELIHTMDSTLNTLNEVSQNLDKMILIYKNQIYQDMLNKRINDYINPMKNHAKMVFEDLEDCNGDEKKIKEVLDDWANGSVNGEIADMRWRSFVDFLTGNKIDDKNIYHMYDAYVFNTHAFEHSGYAMREILRETDEVAIAQNAALSILYHRYNDTDTIGIRHIYEKLEIYKKFAEANKIKYRPNKVICQINGAHFYFDNKISMSNYSNRARHMDVDTRYNDTSKGDQIEAMVYGGKIKLYAEKWEDMKNEFQTKYLREYCLTEKEMNVIANYYKGNKNFVNLMEVFVKEGGMVNPFGEGQPAIYGSRFLSSEGYTIKENTYAPIYIKTTLNLWKRLDEELVEKNMKLGEVELKASSLCNVFGGQQSKYLTGNWHSLTSADGLYKRDIDGTYSLKYSYDQTETNIFFQPFFTKRYGNFDDVYTELK